MVTWNELDDPYNAEAEEESPNALSCRMQSEYSKINRHRRLFNAGTANLIPPATTTEAMDTSDNCPGPAAEPASPRQTPATASGTMDTTEDFPSAATKPSATATAAATTAATPTARPSAGTWKQMNRCQRKNWLQRH